MNKKIKYPFWVWLIFLSFCIIVFIFAGIFVLGILLIIFFLMKKDIEGMAKKLGYNHNLDFIALLFGGVLAYLLIRIEYSIRVSIRREK